MMSHLSLGQHEYKWRGGVMWGMCTQWLVVNNSLFCFIGNRDTTLFSTRTPLGQGLQTHSSRMHHREKTASHFMLLYYVLSLTIKRHSLMAWTHTGVLLARWHDASQPYCESLTVMYLLCFYTPDLDAFCCLFGGRDESHLLRSYRTLAQGHAQKHICTSASTLFITLPCCLGHKSLCWQSNWNQKPSLAEHSSSSSKRTTVSLCTPIHLQC